jgi:cytochrome d ubiquinol oxidase subunit I
MQHPVGYKVVNGKPQLTSVTALFTNPVFLWGYTHVVLASLVTGSLVMLSVSAWHLRRGPAPEPFRRTATVAIVVLLPAILLTLVVGSHLGVIEDKYQPMKIAAAEAQWNTCQPCSFSVFQIGGGNNDEVPTQIFSIPHLLSLLATGTWNGQVTGMNQLNAEYQQKYGPGNYVPNVFIQYWSMRVMAYLGSLIFLLAAWGGWLVHRKKLDRSRAFLFVATWAVVTPFLMNTAGWLLTESGRQPWIVQGLMKTVDAASPSVTSTDIWISLSAFVAVYVVLGIVDGFLMVRFSRKELGDDSDGIDEQGAGPALAY